MATFSFWATFGLCLLKLCLTETEFNVSCRYGGVFHVEKNGRYSLTRSEAVELCRALNSTLATLEQLKKAHELGFETCRYGFVVGHIVIPRINPYHLCAANNTGIYHLSANTTARYDAYCYNETETADKTCEPVVKIDTSLLSNQDETVIDNADGSRYNADGTRHAGGESSTSGVEEENAGSGSAHETTPLDATIRRTSTSYYGSPTPVSQVPDHTSGGDEKGVPGKDYDDEFPSVSPGISFGTVAGDFHEEDDGQYPASPTVDSHHETLLEITTQEHWSPTFTDEEEQYPSSATRALVASENEKHQEPTQHPLLHSVHSGGISQEQNPASTTDSIEQHEFSTAAENYFGKETSTAVVPSQGTKENDSEHEPLVYPGWEQGEEHATQPAGTDRVIPSRDSNLETDSSTTASPDGAHHEEPTEAGIVLWDDESEMSSEGIINPTDVPEDEALHRTTATVIKAVTASTDILAPEGITQETWAPHLVVTAASSPDGAHHQEPTQTPLPSDDEPGQGTEGNTSPMDIPRDGVLHRTTASVTQTAIVEAVGDAEQEKATKEPLAPGTAPGREGEPATTTEGFHVHGMPGDFSDIEDRFVPLQDPFTTSSSVYGDQGPHKGHYESTTSPGETATTKIASQPRSAAVPDWLIIVVALVVLALILAVCIAVNSRRRCGQKQKLVINNGKGAVEDRKTRELNGDISKSQEMVHLVHKEQSNDRTAACDEFLTVNETQNHHEFDMKTGV
ncbi:PREDICTED: CD44 antigen isoform X1 [Sturnus vulgaris]|uniref:CD44 antigen isoform X1 n=1 Tax=Sturnus vulgaris TaxID=9172 RepID=UPI00071A6565|nr:PREDICTED: CD44 antigen isoform X1 [Sturnus vulgaris]